MNYNVLLISEQELKNNTPITENVDVSELRFSIQQSQQIFLQETLGTNLFEFILDLVETNQIGDPQYVRYKELIRNFIRPMLISYSYYIALDNFYIKFVNVGLQQFRSEQSNPIDLKTLQYLKNNARDNAQFNDNLLRRHLVFNNQWYPQYTLVENNGQLIPEFQGAFKTPITLPGGHQILGNYGIRGGNGVYDCPYPWWYGGRQSGE
jgi:hypothetical protein